MGMDDAGLPVQRTHLFLLRMWPEEVGREQIDWRGSVRHVNSGEVRYFREWPMLEAFVEGLLRQGDPAGQRADEAGQQPGSGRADA